MPPLMDGRRRRRRRRRRENAARTRPTLLDPFDPRLPFQTNRNFVRRILFFFLFSLSLLQTSFLLSSAR